MCSQAKHDSGTPSLQCHSCDVARTKRAQFYLTRPTSTISAQWEVQMCPSFGCGHDLPAHIIVFSFGEGPPENFTVRSFRRETKNDECIMTGEEHE